MVSKLSLSLSIAGLTVQLIASSCAAAETSPANPPPPPPPRKSPAKSGAKAATAASAKPSSSPSPPPAAAASQTTAAATAGKKPRAEVLNPDQFFGMAMIGYAAAKAAPDVMENLFCYCGCDLTDSHTSLLDCFTSIHGVDCHICQDEAQVALKLHKQGLPMLKIQQQIDEEFSKQYPFEEDTPTYKNYKAHRLWVKGAAADTKPDAAASGNASGPDPKNPKLKPGAKAGNCCGGNHTADKAK
ncbi:MAG: CYCXC family (seleno)protein [Candidatus Obscuribacterales bacterium]